MTARRLASVFALALSAACAQQPRAEGPVVERRPFSAEDSAAALAAGVDIGYNPAIPCGDSLYVALQGVHPDSMSEREYDYFRSRDASCMAWRTAQTTSDAQAAAIRDAAERSERAGQGIVSMLFVGLIVIPIAVWMWASSG